MALKTFSLEEAYGPVAQLVPAKREPRTSNILDNLEQASAVPEDKEIVRGHFNTVAKEFGLKINQIERSPEENATLKGAAKHSRHLDSMAVDYSTHGMDAKKIADVEKRMHGLGFKGGYTTRGTAPHMHFELPKGQTIAQQTPEEAIEEVQGGGGGSTPKGTFSLEEAYGPVAAQAPKKENKGFLQNSVDAIKDVSGRGFAVIMERLGDNPERVERTPEEIKRRSRKKPLLYQRHSTVPSYSHREVSVYPSYGFGRISGTYKSSRRKRRCCS